MRISTAGYSVAPSSNDSDAKKDIGIMGKVVSFFNSIVEKLKAVITRVPVIASKQQSSSLPLQQLNDFKINRLEVAIKLFDNSKLNLLSQQGGKELYAELKRTLDNERGTQLKTQGVDRLATREEILSAKSLVPDIINKLSVCLNKSKPELSNKQAKREIREAFKACSTELLNNTQWNRITTSFTFDGQKFTSHLIPAAQMKSKGHNIFKIPYNEHGVCSADQKNIDHAVNLWISEFAATDKSEIIGKSAATDGHEAIDKITLTDRKNNQIQLFSGIRHSVLSPYLLALGSKERADGAINRGKEVVTAALFLDQSKWDKALKGETVTLNLTSTSLLTPQDTFGETEEAQLADQIMAWRALSSEKPLTLSVHDSSGELKDIKVNLNVAAFNFGVNQMALKLTNIVNRSNDTSDGYNAAAFTTLLGNLSPSAEIGGWVGEYLKSAPSNTETVLTLSRQLKDIINNKSHHFDRGDPYKAARITVLLSHAIGVTPCWNCKSGKDRTGMLDAEIKREVASMHLNSTEDNLGLPGKPGPLDAKGSALMQQVLLNSGNLEIQRQNTGAVGNKVLKTNQLLDLLGLGLSVRKERIADESVADQGRGLADLV